MRLIKNILLSVGIFVLAILIIGPFLPAASPEAQREQDRQAFHRDLDETMRGCAALPGMNQGTMTMEKMEVLTLCTSALRQKYGLK